MTPACRWNANRPCVIAVALAGLALCGCAPNLLPFDTATTPQVLTYAGAPPIIDGRARFRQLVCASAAQHGSSRRVEHPDCNDILWRLDDEQPAQSSEPALPAALPEMRVLIVPGAFEECYPAFGMPFEEAAAALAHPGSLIGYVRASGRGSADRNAAEIAETVVRLPENGAAPIVLLGYSKGIVDVLHFLVEFPQAAQRVAAVVSVAGPVNGSPLADWLSGAYAEAFSGMPLPNCPPMDGGVLESLRRERQMQWLASNPLPRRIRYFSLAAFTRRGNIHPLMLFTYDLLALIDPRNDGYVLWTDQVIPGSTLLGYADLDHYDVALPVRERLNFGGQKSRGPEREILLEAILLTVSEELHHP